jgi:hypothetical protein
MSASRVSVMLYTSSGQSRVFSVDSTDSTSSYATLTDVITGNDLGDSLQGQTVIKAMATSENFVYSPGIVFVDNQNNIVGQVGAEQPEQVQPTWQKVSIPVQLNYQCKVLTQASVA